MKNKIIGILGGDARYGYLGSALAAEGFEVWAMLLDPPDMDPTVHRAEDFRDALPFCGALILPTPVCKDGLMLNAPFWPRERGREIGQFLEEIGKSTIVLGGGFSPELRGIFGSKELRFTDLMELEPLAVANAVPTAEGAVALAMAQMNITISGSNSCVVGCGRCGRALARLLAAMGSRVTVTARRPEQLGWIEAQGWRPLETVEMHREAHRWDVVFCTIPAPVVTPAVLEGMNREAVIIDIASAPGGTDFTCAAKLGIKATLAPGLPGKAAPKTAGLILRDIILPILEERGMTR